MSKASISPELGAGDHTLWLYETENEHRIVATGFIYDGLEHDERILYITDRHDPEEVLGYLCEIGVNGERYIDQGQLSVVSADQIWALEGELNIKRIIAALRIETEKAIDQGYAALRFTGEMTWALRTNIGSERLIEYEMRLTKFFPWGKFISLCQYDRKCFNAHVLRGVLISHPTVILGTESYTNIYFNPKISSTHPINPEFYLTLELNYMKTQNKTVELLTKRLKEKTTQSLKEVDRNFLLLFDSSFDAIVIFDRHGNIADVNKTTAELLSYNKEELTTFSWQYLHPINQYQRIKELIKRVSTHGRCYIGETALLTKKGKIIPVEARGIIIERSGELFTLVYYRDISARKSAEAQKQSHLMKFNIQEGEVYLVEETKPVFAKSVFSDIMKTGYSGLAISRTPEEVYRRDLEGNYEFLWLAQMATNCIWNNDPSTIIKEIEVTITGMPAKSVILLERMDYLVAHEGFNNILLFVCKLKEIAYLYNSIIILCIDASTLNKEEFRLLEQETKRIDTRFIASLPDDFVEILRFVYRQNNLGIKPSYKHISDRLQISRPTARKRIGNLSIAGYIRITGKGRRKEVDLTPRGIDLFTNDQ
ncbi:MAG: MEDS domain-containing protein [Candidatus Thorarchaeota archaeon]